MQIESLSSSLNWLLRRLELVQRKRQMPWVQSMIAIRWLRRIEPLVLRMRWMKRKMNQKKSCNWLVLEQNNFARSCRCHS